MPRPLRIQYPGAIYHLMNRGDRREAIFHDDDDRRLCLTTRGEVCAKTGWQWHAWCVMGNHFHLVAETPQPNLVTGMRWFLGTYTGSFNRRHRMSGHLFGATAIASRILTIDNGWALLHEMGKHNWRSRYATAGPSIAATWACARAGGLPWVGGQEFSQPQRGYGQAGRKGRNRVAVDDFLQTSFPR